jgi:protocatechuate 3,4-dioxygenase beta subunit
MSDKALLALISIFVLAVVAGIVYLFIASAGDEGAIAESPAAEIEQEQETEVISRIPEEETESVQVTQPRERIDAPAPDTPVGAMAGRVLDVSDRPVPEARVSLYKSVPSAHMMRKKPTYHKAVTDGSGRYVIEAVPEGSGYSLLAEADDHASAEITGLSVAAEKTLNVADFRLDAGFAIHGTVSDPSGRALAGVEVKAVDKMKQMATMPAEVHTRSTATDQEGRFSLPFLSPTQYEITFTAEGYRSLTLTENFILSTSEEGGRELDVQLDPGGLTIAGAVYGPESNPIEGARIQALFSSPARNAHFTAVTQTGHDGTFVLPGLSEGNYTLMVTAKGFYQRDANTAQAGEAGITVAMLPTGAVQGSIKAKGRTPSRYRVRIDKYTASVRVSGQNRKPEISCGPKSEFKYPDLLPGKYIFLVDAPGYAQTRSGEVEVRSGEVTRGLEVALARGGGIKGTCADRSGNGLSGVKIQLMDKTYEPSLPFEEFFLIKPEQGKSMTTDGNGKFELKNIRAGTYVLKMDSDSMARKVIKDVLVEEGSTSDLGVIRLTKGGRIRGVAYDHEGLPAQGAKVTAVSTQTGNRKTVTSDDKGRFDIKSLAPGEYQVSLNPKDFWSALKYQSTVSVYVDDHQTTQVDIYTLPAEKKEK